jgi:AcrR family transcriptional regulator
VKIKEKLLAVTMKLIKEKKGNINDITIREIAKRAKTGVGLINYHFQSKENLINLCVQKIVSGVITESKPDMGKLSPMEKLKTSVKIPIDFLMTNPDISKISILGDFTQGQQNDNTFQTLARYYQYASSVDAGEDTFFKTVFLIHGLQGIFLRKDLYKDTFDFSNKTERDKLIDTLVENIFGGTNVTK